MKVKDLARMLYALPPEYIDSNVYLTMVLDDTNSNSSIENSTLYCDVVEFSIDLEDGVVVIKGAL